ncbi:MAG: hypothetical protein WBZ36_12275 [Candidatus Nitrosopolaris sp.]
MGHTATYSVRLLIDNSSIHYATIVGSAYHAPNTESFYIGNKGLVDDNPNAAYFPTISYLYDDDE